MYIPIQMQDGQAVFLESFLRYTTYELILVTLRCSFYCIDGYGQRTSPSGASLQYPSQEWQSL
jgi:hypothetical protein